jgi:hypothetical protein
VLVFSICNDNKSSGFYHCDEVCVISHTCGFTPFSLACFLDIIGCDY